MFIYAEINKTREEVSIVSDGKVKWMGCGCRYIYVMPISATPFRGPPSAREPLKIRLSLSS